MLAANFKLQPEITIENISNAQLTDDFCIFIGYYIKRYQIDICQSLKNNSWVNNFFDEHDNSIDGISYKLATLYNLEESYVFNQILLAHIYQKDGVNIPPHEQGNMIKKLKNYIPEAFSGFHDCHELRCEINKIHAYSQTTGKLNKVLKSPFRERDKLKKKLEIAYESILDHIKENHI